MMKEKYVFNSPAQVMEAITGRKMTNFSANLPLTNLKSLYLYLVRIFKYLNKRLVELNSKGTKHQNNTLENKSENKSANQPFKDVEKGFTR